jgi:hypothetical protein
VIGPGCPEHLAPVAEALDQPVTARERAMIEEALGGLADGPPKVTSTSKQLGAGVSVSEAIVTADVRPCPGSRPACQ